MRPRIFVCTLLLAIWLSGCAQPSIDAFNKTISREQAESMYPNSFVVLADKAYVMPTKEWVDGCIRAYKRRYATSFIYKWSKRWDCDNRSRHLSSYMRERFARQCPDKIEPDGVAIFVRFYHQEEGGGHAIVTMIIDNKIVDYDAVSMEYVDLTAKEHNMSWYVGD